MATIHDVVKYIEQKKIYILCLIYCLFYHVYSQDKWIVVTTIQHPTPQLKKISRIPGWRMVVVGDKKTPLDWHLENCEYLSPEKQLSLGYKISSMLPWNHYSRKNIGYLYAIQHGASIIYETDDDNEPLFDLHYLDNIQQNLLLLASEEPCINVYHYFGLHHVWPRGYPLEKIICSHVYDQTTVVTKEIGVEQGLVNGDPDVDAIYRLTQYTGEITFPRSGSCVLSMANYCPFNSQNTFIHKKAFFTLYLPSTVTMRVSDIWRSYYAQKLMKLCGLYLAFSGPNAFQDRNNHNYMHDYIQEQDLYYKSMDLVNFIHAWQSPKNSNTLQNMHDLISDLVKKEFLGPDEISMCDAWLEDLMTVGYLQ